MRGADVHKENLRMFERVSEVLCMFLAGEGLQGGGVTVAQLRGGGGKFPPQTLFSLKIGPWRFAPGGSGSASPIQGGIPPSLPPPPAGGGGIENTY